MSSSSFIDINFKDFSRVNALELLKSMFDFGWELNDQGRIVYLPIGDDDNFDWRVVSIERKQAVLNEIQKKQNLKELIGVVVTYKDSLVGGELLFIPNKNQVSFSLSINTRSFENGITDFQWYEDRILPCLLEIKKEVKSIYLCQSDSSGEVRFEKNIIDLK